MSKKSSHKKQNHKKLTKLTVLRYCIKILLVGVIFSLILFQTQDKSFTNTIPLLAVNENEQGNITGGSTIDLKLTITKGTGEIFVNTKSLKEIDTQLSITNGHHTACSLYELPCDNYNFYFSFEGTSTVLKGPSATASIALITAKTINKKKLNNDVVITGSLNSAGVIGTVGGIEKKIEVAQRRGFKKILIPLLASQNISKNSKIDVKPVLSLTQAYNEFDQDKLELPQRSLDKSSYTPLMRSLVDELCGRTQNLEQELGNTQYSNNTSNKQLYQTAQQNINSSNKAIDRESYYSAASFCFSANNNLQTLIQKQTNHSKQTIQSNISKLNKTIEQKKTQLNNPRFIQNNIQTRNDFYVFLILQDRVHEAKEFINPHLENTTNTSTNELITSYAFSKERFETIALWETFIAHQGDRVSFSQEIIDDACQKITSNINAKAKVLQQYEISAFDNLIEKQQNISGENSYNCLYNGLELSGRINTLFFSYNIQQNSSQNITEQLFELTQSTIARGSGDNFPLLPFIYYEYAQELNKQQNYQSSLLYTNYALEFSNVDFYLQKPQSITKTIIENSKNKFLTSPLLLLGLILLAVFS